MSKTRIQVGSIVIALLAAAVTAARPGGSEWNRLSIAFLMAAGVLMVWMMSDHYFGRPKLGRDFWLSAEQAFARIDGEVTAIWQRYDNGHVEWSIQPDTEKRGTTRTVDRFLAEARRCGAVVKAAGLPRKFGGYSADVGDYWLDAVAIAVYNETEYHLDGIESGRGYHSGADMNRMVDASKAACAKFAAESKY